MNSGSGVKVLRQFVGGAEVDAAGGATFDVFDPYTRRTVLRAAAGGPRDVEAAVEAAAAAQPEWAQTRPSTRQAILLRAADIVEQRRDEIVGQLARETGAAFGFAQFQIEFVAGLLRNAAGSAYAPLGQIMPSDVPGCFSMSIRKPVGVVAAIAPWNGALLLSARSIAAPLVFGNSVVLKPSELSPYVGGTIWAEIFSAAGLPDGVLNVVTHAPGEAGAIGDVLVQHPLVRRINFTGSTSTGRKLAEACGRHLKRIVLELGGRNPLIVLDDADVDYAVDAAAFGAYMHQGQVCMAARQILVEKGIAGEFTDKLVAKTASLKSGDPSERDTVIGPLINESAVQMVQRRVDDAVRGGAEILVGGQADGPVFPATLVRNVPDECELARLETFGPVATVEVVGDGPEAVRRANATPYGLAAGIITRDSDYGMALAQQLNSGVAHVNDQPIGDEPHVPFGGVKDSGWGRFGGTFAMDEFTEMRWITIQETRRQFPF